MKTVIISSAAIIPDGGFYYGYSPYVNELAIWASYSDIAMTCPVWETDRGLLVSRIGFPIEKIFGLKDFNVKGIRNIIHAFGSSFHNFFMIYKAMRWADHIHLRCPGNVGLMGCIVQILFPHKLKTAKYAGNWDPNARQPLSYRLQKWILGNTFLTRNMRVLVYGKWPGSSKNIKPFFTATYRESDKIPVQPRRLAGTLRFVFVGTLSAGKRPVYAIRLVEKLRDSGYDAALDLYGNGLEMDRLKRYIADNNLSGFVRLMGNQSQEIVRNAYIESHFAILPSKSEGWPKAVAEAMFWGCLPIATKVSCVPFMLDGGNRGLLLDIELEADTAQIISLIGKPEEYKAKVAESIAWSRQFTLDLFEKEIKVLLQP